MQFNREKLIQNGVLVACVLGLAYVMSKQKPAAFTVFGVLASSLGLVLAISQE